MSELESELINHVLVSRGTGSRGTFSVSILLNRVYNFVYVCWNNSTPKYAQNEHGYINRSYK